MKKDLGFIAKRFAVALLVAIGSTCWAVADDSEKLTFKVGGFTYRVLQDNKVELIEIPQKFNQLKQSNCHIDLTPIIKYKKQYYELASIPDNVFSDVHRDNHMVLKLPTTVKHIGAKNQIHDLYYDTNLYNNWMDTNNTVLLSKDGSTVVWVNRYKSGKFKQIPVPEKIKVIPSWFWQCFPNLQQVAVPEGLDEAAIEQLFDGCTPYMRGRNLFLVRDNNTGEVVWKSPLCSHATILDYPSTWSAADQSIVNEYFTSLELCLADGSGMPCIYMHGTPYNSQTGEPAVTPTTHNHVSKSDTLSLSVNQFKMTTPEFIAYHVPKYINIVNNTKGDIKFDRELLRYVSQLVTTQNVNTSLSRIGKCYVEDTPFENYFGNLYNPNTGELFILTRQDTLQVWMNDENRETMTNYIEQLTAANAVKHVVYASDDTVVDEDDNEVFAVVETGPEFPGGMGELMKFLNHNIRYPSACMNQGIQGRVVVQFVVDENGNIKDAKVVKSVNPHLDKEAIRVISSMPPWKPGTQRGRPVRFRFTMPVTFRLSE